MIGAASFLWLLAGLLQKKSQEGTQTTMEATLMAQQTPAQREQVQRCMHMHTLCLLPSFTCKVRQSWKALQRFAYCLPYVCCVATIPFMSAAPAQLMLQDLACVQCMCSFLVMLSLDLGIFCVREIDLCASSEHSLFPTWEAPILHFLRPQLAAFFDCLSCHCAYRYGSCSSRQWHLGACL